MQTLGQRIHAQRTLLGWSLNALASRADVSRAMLSKVERGESSPTITVLQKVAGALGVSAGALIGMASPRPVVVLRAAEAGSFVDPATGYERQIFPLIEDSPLEVMRGVLPAGGTSGDLPLQPAGARKYVIVEAGSVRLQVGEGAYGLEEGDVCLFPADAEHRFDNPGDRPCRLLMVKLPPTGR